MMQDPLYMNNILGMSIHRTCIHKIDEDWLNVSYKERE